MTTSASDNRLAPGCVVHCRSHRYLVEDVERPELEGGDTIVRMACLDDDANGQQLEVFWEREVDARVLAASTWQTVGQRGFDDAQVFSSYLHTLRWNCVTSTDPGLFQAPLRAGIEVKPYQLEPLRKALRMPRVNLFIADDVGLGKTIEAGLILRELLLRQKVHRVVVVAPPSVVLQWQEEMQARFGLDIAVMNRRYVAGIRRDRGWGINPWTTHSRFILSQALLRDEAYAGPLRDWLAMNQGKQSLLILDEAHNAAPASGRRYAIDSRLTRSIRELASLFEHKLFLSATPHNGHSNSFSALLEILDPTRFCRGVNVRKQDLERVLVRRLKEDLRQIGVDLPKRNVNAVVLNQLPPETPELQLAELLQQYRSSRNHRLAQASPRQRASEQLVITNLQKRLLSSIEAFHCTLGVHIASLEQRQDQQRKRNVDPRHLDLLLAGIDGDDERAELDEAALIEEEQDQHRQALRSALAVQPQEWELLQRMRAISSNARYTADARIAWLQQWLKDHLCPELGRDGAQWQGERLLIFTEYADTKRWLETRLRELVAGSDRDEERLATFHGGIGDERREALKRSFNSPPAEDPLRILIATDAAREGVNLQNHCRHLVHFDVPWNPGRMEQRNGRIDRTLQRAREVYCHYFVLPQRPEDNVLQRLVEKTETIKQELGCLPTLVLRKLDDLLAKGIDPTALQSTLQAIDGVNRDEAFKRTQHLIGEELEDSRERSGQLREQVRILEGYLRRSEDWLHFSSGLFRDALDTSLGLQDRHNGSQQQLRLMPLDPEATANDPDRARWKFPDVEQLPGGEARWGDVLDTLRAPRQPGQNLWEWRCQCPPQPVVFKDPQVVNADRVHLHLEHPLVKRLLNSFLSRGFQTDALQRASVLGTDDDTAKLILLARLSLYGHGAARLHDEVLALVAEWDPADPARRLRVLNKKKSDQALVDLEQSLLQRLELPIDRHDQLQRHLANDVEQLLPRLDQLVEATSGKAQERLGRRADEEAATFVRVLAEQRERISNTKRRIDSSTDQLVLDFGNHKAEWKQLKQNREYWERRLQRIEQELQSEPALIRRTFEVATAPRVEPAGAIYLWPVAGGR
ncbi:MAG: helicase [Aphanocapsa feldmannii 277cV]|uniref:Helicase n=2 Tax=Aphanocapsa feldmannii TaxID=192050 RepID=A0A524RM94_9CHRO|nr:MAG: helicase [Aphanocapsa feldmannii 277cV]TGH20874.1 MAG: helicase [Aphanocapsa feldmannii 277cI]